MHFSCVFNIFERFNIEKRATGYTSHSTSQRDTAHIMDPIRWNCEFCHCGVPPSFSICGMFLLGGPRMAERTPQFNKSHSRRTKIFPKSILDLGLNKSDELLKVITRYEKNQIRIRYFIWCCPISLNFYFLDFILLILITFNHFH